MSGRQTFRLTYPDGSSLEASRRVCRDHAAAYLKASRDDQGFPFEAIVPGRLWLAGGGAAVAFRLRIDPLSASGNRDHGREVRSYYSAELGRRVELEAPRADRALLETDAGRSAVETLVLPGLRRAASAP